MFKVNCSFKHKYMNNDSSSLENTDFDKLLID